MAPKKKKTPKKPSKKASKKTKTRTRLGVNVDHVATLRRLRDTPYPNLLAAAKDCIAGGAEQITIHLREDRRHIVDADVATLRKHLKVDINLEVAATEEMLAIALKTKPYSICVVPEKREERTTEGGLNLSNPERNVMLRKIAEEATRAGIVVSFFIEPDTHDMRVSKELGATAVELHTGALCIAHQTGDKTTFAKEWKRLEEAVAAGPAFDLTVNAGHGIDYEIAPKLAKAFPSIYEYNIGHAIVCEAVFCGIRQATRKMKRAITPGRGAKR